MIPTLAQLRAEAEALQRQRQFETVYRLGSRAGFEFFEEIRRHHPEIAHDLDLRLQRFTGLDRVTLQVAGGDRMPPPIWRAS